MNDRALRRLVLAIALMVTPLGACSRDEPAREEPRKPEALGFYTVAPCRVYDSRREAPLDSGRPRTLAVAGKCGIPSTARAVAANLTALDATGPGHLLVDVGGGAASPATTRLSFGAGQARSNNAIVGLSADGKGTVKVQATLQDGGQVHVILEVSGYFA